MTLTGYTDFDANLWEIVYEGVYNGNKLHWTDYDRVINRALARGFDKIIIQATELKPCRRALEIAREFNDHPRRVFTSTGLQPSYPHMYMDLLGPREKYRPYVENILIKNRRYVTCVGKTGLMFTKAGIEACSKEKQIDYLNMHLEFAAEYGLPIVLQSRNSAKETLECLKAFEGKVTPVLSSFSGTMSEAETYLKLGAYIGISGCSLKRTRNINVVKSLPLSRILLGSDCPYCKLKRDSPSYKYVKTKFRAENRRFWSPSAPVKGRTEPIHVIQLVEATAGIRGVEVGVVVEETWKNFHDVFFSSNSSPELTAPSIKHPETQAHSCTDSFCR
ncbi:deoxyribonuclease TATDN1-like [Macrosteles quadrilineatus]|uniref:deoxyribonuclease TATDN1-like n=1 Tax=Macrosteles quadrilineatus TaxID=74068 RepID=UPI0023E2C442|nr:deoxyribonuclease TATDN1-like [Macrosteles quadrilineatus]